MTQRWRRPREWCAQRQAANPTSDTMYYVVFERCPHVEHHVIVFLSSMCSSIKRLKKEPHIVAWFARFVRVAEAVHCWPRKRPLSLGPESRLRKDARRRSLIGFMTTTCYLVSWSPPPVDGVVTVVQGFTSSFPSLLLLPLPVHVVGQRNSQLENSAG